MAVGCSDARLKMLIGELKVAGDEEKGWWKAMRGEGIGPGLREIEWPPFMPFPASF